MDIKQAVTTAKSHVATIFQDEGITPPTLEEIEFDDNTASWKVTVGFVRPGDEPQGIAKLVGTPLLKQYKVVRILDATGEPLSIRNRDLT